MKKMRRTLGIHCNKINILSLASHGRHTLFYYTHTHADYRVNMCNLINQPLFGRRKKQTHIHNMQTQTC